MPNPSTIWTQLATPNAAAGGIPFVSTDNQTVIIDVLNFYWNQTAATLSVHTNGDYTGTDAINSYLQHDSYLPASQIAATPSLSATTPGFTTSASQGTGTVPLASITGDFLGQFSSWGYDVVGGVGSYNPHASMYAIARGVVTGNVGGELHLATKTDGGILTDRLVIDNLGQITLQNSITSPLVVGTGAGTAVIGSGVVKGVDPVGVDISGGSLTLSTGQSTGAAQGATIRFQVPIFGASGATPNAFVTVGTISSSTGQWNLGGGNAASAGVIVGFTANTVNHINLNGSIAGSNAVSISAGGADTNVSINYGTQGTGTHNFTGALVLKSGSADQSKSVQVPTTGFNITIAASTKTLILDPAGVLATGTIVMPAAPIDGQEIRITSTQTITALTVSANAGQSIKNAPTTLAVSLTAPEGFAYIYHLANTTWYRTQ